MNTKTMLWILTASLAAGCTGKNTASAAEESSRKAAAETAAATADRLAREHASAEEAKRAALEQLEAGRRARDELAAEDARLARERDNAPVPPPVEEAPSAADLALAQSLSQALLNDATLPESAKALVVSTQKGMITLRGSVATEEEKHAVEAAVRAVLGTREFDNQIVVKPG